METRIPGDPIRFQRLSTAELRQSYLLEELFVPGEVRLLYVETDRAVVGAIVPTNTELSLSASKELASGFFCERREAGVLNLGQGGTITVDGKAYPMGSREALYIGRGSKQVTFTSDKASDPAQFYLVSYPAHAAYPTTHVRPADAEKVHLGAAATCNDRTINKYIHAGGVKSCQLVMGITSLAEGSAWNTMPCHTHARRSEIYLYFDLKPENLIVHLMGPPQETRHLMVRDRQAIALSTWVPYLGADLGSLIGGLASAYFVKRGMSVINARKLAMCCFAALMPAAIPAFWAKSPYVALMFITVATTAHQAWAASILTLPADLFPKRAVASAYGFTGMCGTLASGLFQLAVGGMVQNFGYGPIFMIVGFMHPIAAIVIVLFIRSRPKTPVGGFPVQPA